VRPRPLRRPIRSRYGLAKNWSAVEKVSRASLSATHAFSASIRSQAADGLDRIARTVASPDLIPSVPGPMPRAARALRSTQRNGAAAVYFPACINRMVAAIPTARLRRPCRRRSSHYPNEPGKPLWIPSDVAGLCCSTPWKSKAIPKATSSWPSPSPTPCCGERWRQDSDRR